MLVSAFVWIILPHTFCFAQEADDSRSNAAHPSAKELPSSADLNNQGVEAAAHGHFEQAVPLLKQALSLEPNDAQIKKNLSGMLIDWACRLDEKGLSDKASAAAEESLTYDPDNGKTLLFLGTLAYARNDLSKAVGFWKRTYGKILSAEWTALSRQISQTERDILIERKFADLETDHFSIRIEGSQEAAGTKAAVGALCEREYIRLSQMIGSAPERFTVIVYTNDDFRRIAEGKHDEDRQIRIQGPR